MVVFFVRIGKFFREGRKVVSIWNDRCFCFCVIHLHNGVLYEMVHFLFSRPETQEKGGKDGLKRYFVFEMFVFMVIFVVFP